MIGIYRLREDRAAPIEAIDGDTVRVLVDPGYYNRTQADIRLVGVFKPELDEPGGPEAKAFVQAWLDARPTSLDGRPGTLKWPLWLQVELTKVPEPNEVRSFTRYVGTVLDIATGESLNAQAAEFIASLGAGTGP